MKTLLIVGLLVIIIAGYMAMNQASTTIESQVSPEEINATLDDAGNTLLDETNDIVIGELM